MHLFSRILVLSLAAIAIYSIWPRDASLKRFDPESIATHEATAWKALKEQNLVKATGNLYWIYDQEYQFSPVRAMVMAMDYSAALNGILESPEEMDKESQVPKLVEIFVTKQRETQENFDAPGAGRAEFLIWFAVSQRASQEDLEKAIAHSLNTIHQLTPASSQTAAKLRAEAVHKAFISGPVVMDEKQVRAALLQYWKEMKRILPPPPEPEN